MTQGNKVLQAMGHGVKVAAADEASSILLSMLEKSLGEAYPEIAKTTRGQELAKLLAAVVLHYLATKQAAMMPQAENVAGACELVIEASTRDAVQPIMSSLREDLSKLAAVYAPLADSK